VPAAASAPTPTSSGSTARAAGRWRSATRCWRRSRSPCAPRVPAAATSTRPSAGRSGCSATTATSTPSRAPAGRCCGWPPCRGGGGSGSTAPAAWCGSRRDPARPGRDRQGAGRRPRRRPRGPGRRLRRAGQPRRRPRHRRRAAARRLAGPGRRRARRRRRRRDGSHPRRGAGDLVEHRAALAPRRPAAAPHRRPGHRHARRRPLAHRQRRGGDLRGRQRRRHRRDGPRRGGPSLARLPGPARPPGPPRRVGRPGRRLAGAPAGVAG
jgi:hypothetical protein